MGRKQRPAALPPDVRQVLSRIERWRRTRKKRTAMPEQMWEGAAALARVHGVYWTARELGLSYDSLKKRVEGGPGGSRGERGDHSGFIEVGAAPLMGFGQPSGAVVELSDTDGARLVIRLTEGGELDARDLAEAFWGRRS
jgi:hypothetical protein